MVVKDANDFKNNFGNSTSMVVLRQEANASDKNSTDRFLAGIRFNPEKKDFDTINKSDLANIERLYKEDKLSTLGADYYKVFVIELASFDEVSLYNISDQNVELTKDEMKAVLVSDHARDTLAEIISKKNGKTTAEVLKDLAATDEKVKGYILSYYLSTVFNPSNLGEFMSQLKSDNIQVYHNTALFKAIKLIPQTLINMVVN